MAEIELKTVKLGLTQKDNYETINTNFANLDLGKLDADGTAVNAEKVNGLTVETAVPKNAVFLTEEEKNSFITEDEVADAVKYTNETPIVTAIGGIKVGETFTDKTVQEMLDKLLYPYVKPTVSITVAPNGGTYEKGTSVAITSLKVTATRKSADLTKVEAKNGSIVLATVTDNVAKGGTFDCLPADGLTLTANATLTGSVTDKENSTVTANSSAFTFVDPFYYGVVATGTAMTSDTVKALTKSVTAKGTKTFTYTTNNNCMVIAYPKSYGELKSALDPNKFENISSYTQSTVTVACASGDVEYYVYVKTPSTADGFAITYSF